MDYFLRNPLIWNVIDEILDKNTKRNRRVPFSQPEKNVTTLVPHYYNNHRSEYWILINKHIGLSEEWFEKSLQNLFKESAPLPVAEK
ncbi:hypothetical protein V1477_021125 [Vespula maculifrons]|uniref:Uncharacterized protein n=1 Tax=Vespula maculifrons TaxID=7453 RepID=A0ABD2AH89_VESMC